MAREDRSWRDYANCLGVDPNLFFPERGASTREAKEVCRGCVVREHCLEYALANEKFGIWGGMSERERRQIRRQRQVVAAAAAQLALPASADTSFTIEEPAELTSEGPDSTDNEAVDAYDVADIVPLDGVLETVLAE